MVRQLDASGHFEDLSKLNKYQWEFLDTILNGMIADTELGDVLFKLTKILYVLHDGDKVVILIDEYDTLFSYAVGYPYSSQVSRPSQTVHFLLVCPSQANMFLNTPEGQQCPVSAWYPIKLKL